MAKKKSETPNLSHITLTGLTFTEGAKNFKKSAMAGKELPVHCYVCKRRDGEKTFAIAYYNDATETSISMPKLTVSPYRARKGDLKFKYMLCHECSSLFPHLTPVD